MNCKELSGQIQTDGLVNRGNLYRLRRIMRRAMAGQRIVMGFLGGSITQGCLAEDEEHTYVYRVVKWWRQQFPQAVVEFVNAGIGGTSSHYGTARVREDVLAKRPDVVMVDFSVNDEAETGEQAEFFAETFEGVIRQILEAKEEPAVVILNHVFYADGHSAEQVHNRIGKHYDLPCISMRKAVYEKILAGKYEQEEITPDGLHPGNLGHELAAKAVTDFLEQVKDLEQSKGACGSAAKEAVETVLCLHKKTKPEFRPDSAKWLPMPLTDNCYEHCMVIRNDMDMIFQVQGFRVDTRKKSGYLDLFSCGWTARNTGDRISFSIRCSGIAVQYRKVAGGAEQRARAVLDGDEEHGVLLNGRFEESWGDCLYLQTILHHGEYRDHTLVITLIDQVKEEWEKDFYLAAILIHDT